MTRDTTPCARPGCGHAKADHGTVGGCTIPLDTGGWCACQSFVAPAVTPYDGGTSSGHSGSDASRERSERRDADGSTQHIQQTLLAMARERTMTGLTVAEARGILDAHHGTVSGALSVLHKDGQLARLQQKRDRCHVYVLPEYVEGRETRPQGRTRETAGGRLNASERATVTRFRTLVSSPNGVDGKIVLLNDTAQDVLAILERLA